MADENKNAIAGDGLGFLCLEIPNFQGIHLLLAFNLCNYGIPDKFNLRVHTGALFK